MSITDVTKKRGRPATGVNTAITVRIDDALLSDIDVWREAQADAPGRPEAIRRIVRNALNQ